MTVIGPFVAPSGTLATTRDPVTLRIVAVTPPKATARASPRFAPEMLIAAPTGPLVGLKLEILGRSEVVQAPTMAIAINRLRIRGSAFPLSSRNHMHALSADLRGDVLLPD